MENKIKSIEEHVKAIMEILEIKPTEDNARTSYRVAKMYVNEIFSNLNKDESDLIKQVTLFKASKYKTKVIVSGIDFSSTCSHHWMPFFGKVDIEYVPNKSIIGLSKFPRIIEWFSKEPQVQEELTAEIGEFLFDILEPQYIKVVLRDVTHTCIECRGVESVGVKTSTEYIWRDSHA